MGDASIATNQKVGSWNLSGRAILFNNLVDMYSIVLLSCHYSVSGVKP